MNKEFSARAGFSFNKPTAPYLKWKLAVRRYNFSLIFHYSVFFQLSGMSSKIN